MEVLLDWILKGEKGPNMLQTRIMHNGKEIEKLLRIVKLGKTRIMQNFS